VKGRPVQGRGVAQPQNGGRDRVATLQRLLERARHVGEALRRVSMAVGESDQIDHLLQLIVDTTTDVLDADRATLFLREDDKLVSRVKQGHEFTRIIVDIGRGIAGHVAKTGKPLRVKDAYADPRFDPAWDQKGGYRTRSILAAPVRNTSGAIVGVLQVLNKRGEPGLFTSYDAEILQALATQAAVSLDKEAMVRELRARNEDLRQASLELERSLADLELLYDMEAAMSRSEKMSDLARNAVTLIARACEAEAGAVLVKREGDLTLYVVNVARPDDVRQVIVKPGEGLAARCMQLGELAHIGDARHVGDPARVRELVGIAVKNALVAPLLDEEGEALGALALYNLKAGERFLADDARLFRLVAGNVSTEVGVLESRRRRAEAERLGSIGRLLSGVMHDLRTPLAVISGYLQLMESEGDAAARKKHGETIREQFEFISAMQKDLLAYARGETTLLVRKVYLGRFCEGIAKQFKPELAGSTIEFIVDVRHNGVAYFDESKLTRALGNLLRNGIEAMDGMRGTLSLVCDADDEDLIMAVSDTGRGIPKTIKNRLFEPFVTEGKKLGTGLGLANVKKIVGEHGGGVQVESSKKGTTFTIRIPSAMRPHSLRRGEMG
jgi:signal transduction histidine kinase/putative methionine-R-sulfoxide reductase with GAF domain